MNITVVEGDAFGQETPLLVLPLWQSVALPDAVHAFVEAEDWRGTFKQTVLLYPRGAVAARRVLLVGLGKQEDGSTERLREIGGLAAQRARELNVESYALALPNADAFAPFVSAKAVAEGSALGLYRYQRYKTGLSADDTREINDLVVVTASDGTAASEGAAQGEAIARAVTLARDLANGPGNDITPTVLGETAQQLGELFGFSVTVLGPDELREGGFGGIIGVGQGSAQPPRFIVMEHGTKQAGKPTICLVGKGITFDTGGISIKPAPGMEDMKMDMGGAAAVLGAMHAIGTLDLPIHVVGLIASAENMPSSTAFKPGDILQTLSGKTIEVLNTDAEGRVVLADALFYAQRYEPDAIIDLATLTGAIGVALGPHAIGLMSNNNTLARRVLDAGEATGERAWQLPLWDQYKDMVKSDIADVKNSTGRPGGAITAAAFLSNFVGEYPWVHLDIASTAWTERQAKSYAPKGATGIGVRLLVEFVHSWAESE